MAVRDNKANAEADELAKTARERPEANKAVTAAYSPEQGKRDRHAKICHVIAQMLLLWHRLLADPRATRTPALRRLPQPLPTREGPKL